jgi:hypothetical protein
MRTPPPILERFERAAAGLDYGSVSLTLHMKGGAARYVIQKEESFIPTDEPSVGPVMPYKEEKEKRSIIPKINSKGVRKVMEGL